MAPNIYQYSTCILLIEPVTAVQEAHVNSWMLNHSVHSQNGVTEK